MHIVQDKTSVFGIFVRKCNIEFLKSSIPQRMDLFTVFRIYATRSDRAQIGPAGEWISPVISNDPLAKDSEYELEGR